MGMDRVGTSCASCSATCARASIKEETVGKRAQGSLAIQRMMIVVRAKGRPGLISVGKVAMVLVCCIKIVAGLVPRKGGVPVQTS